MRRGHRLWTGTSAMNAPTEVPLSRIPKTLARPWKQTPSAHRLLLVFGAGFVALLYDSVRLSFAVAQSRASHAYSADNHRPVDQTKVRLRPCPLIRRAARLASLTGRKEV